MCTNSDECILYDCIWFFLCHTTSPSVTSFYVCTLVCARAFVVCVFPICNFFPLLSLSLSLSPSIVLLLDPFDCFSASLAHSSSIIYEFIWYFVNGSCGQWTFFFVSSTLFRSSAYNSWLHRSNVLNSAWVFLHTIFVKEKTYLFSWSFFDIVRASFPIEMIACAYNTHHELDIKRMRVLISYKTCEILTTSEQMSDQRGNTSKANWMNEREGERKISKRNKLEIIVASTSNQNITCVRVCFVIARC